MLKLQKTKNSASFVKYMPILPQGFDLFIVEAGYEYCDPSHCWVADHKSGHLFHYVLKGEGKAVVGDREYFLKENDIFYSWHGDEIAYFADEKNPWEYVWVYFDGILSDFYVQQTSFSPENPVRQAVDGKETEHAIRHMIDASNANQTASLLSTGYLYVFLALLIKNYEAEKSAKVNGRVEDIMVYINKNFRREFSMAKMARDLCMDRTTIYRIVKQYLNMSPISYVEKLRISYACDLLKRGEQNINKAALDSGFNDYSWFCKVFKKNLRISPAEYLAQTSFMRQE